MCARSIVTVTRYCYSCDHKHIMGNCGSGWGGREIGQVCLDYNLSVALYPELIWRLLMLLVYRTVQCTQSPDKTGSHISVYHYTLYSAQNWIKPYILQTSSSSCHRILNEILDIWSMKLHTSSVFGKSLFVFSVAMAFNIRHPNDRLTDWAFSGVPCSCSWH